MQGLRRNRKHRRASGVYRLEPLFSNEKGEIVSDGKTYYIDGKIGEYLVVSVPEDTTRNSALELEKNLSAIAKKRVLVVTHNMTFLRAILMTTKEKAEISETINGNTPEVCDAGNLAE